jgi:hypothetical protein
MLGQQLQDANVVAGADRGPVLPFQGRTQLGEDRRQLPVLVDIGVIQRRRLAPQQHQVMQRLEDLLAAAIRTRVPGDHLAAGHDLDVFHIGFHRHRREGVRPRHAVGVVVETHRLVLVHQARLRQARIERPRRQPQRRGALALETLANRLFLTGLRAVAVAQTTGAEVGVQLAPVARLRHRRGPVLLQELHPALDARLFLRPPHQAELRREVVMAGQSQVVLVDLAATALKQVRHHGLGVVPPDLVRHTPEKRECLDQAVQNRLGPLAGHCHRERTIRVAPGHHQHRHLPPPVGKIDVDVPEVGFQALAGIVVEGDEGLALVALLVADIEADPFIAAGVIVLLP